MAHDRFCQKPESAPKTILGNPDYMLDSMGNYIFERAPRVDELKKDSKDKNSDHDFGKNNLPKIFPVGNVFDVVTL